MNGSMIALYPPPDLAAQLAVPGGEPPECIHLTIAYTGPATEVDRETLRAVAKSLAARPPIKATISGHARFTGGEQDVIVALVDGPDIEDLRRDTLNALAAHGIDIPREHGYQPHLTLQYLDPGEPSPVDRIDATPVSFGTINAVHADDRVGYTLIGESAPDIRIAAREAFATGWATVADAPMTDGVRAGCAAATAWASEHSHRPDVLEATVKLGQLEGVWALIYQRRERCEKQHQAAVLAAWRRFLEILALDEMIARFHTQAPNLPDVSPQAIHLQALALARQAFLGANIADPAYGQFLDAITTALNDAQAEGAAAGRGATGGTTDVAAAYDQARSQLGDLTSWGQATPWAARIMSGAATALARTLTKDFSTGITLAELRSAADQALDASPVPTLDQAMSQAWTRGMTGAYADQDITMVNFWTVGDGRVCFPAGTPVRTPSGDVPIEKLAIGDLVTTPKGQRVITNAWSRPYSGPVITVRAANGAVVSATADHPFWTPVGWKDAAELAPGDVLKTAEDVLVEVDRIHHFHLGETNNSPSLSRKVGVAPRVSITDSCMPVDPVSFKRDPDVHEREVDGPSTDRVLLPECDAEALQGLANPRFESAFSSKSPIARERAELALLRFAGNDSLGDAARPTGEKFGRPSAYLGAVAAIESLFCPEARSAALAVDVFGIDGLALLGADCVPAFHAGFDGEAHTTDRADFGHAIGPEGVVAVTAAVDPGSSSLDSGIEEISAVPTLLWITADGIVRCPALATTEDVLELCSGPTHDFFSAAMTDIVEGQVDRLSCSDAVGIKTVQVYDIEVSEEHVFYASGILVHNCSPCQDAEDGNPYPIDAAPQPGLHPHCRCTLAPADMPAPGTPPSSYTAPIPEEE